MAKTIKNGVLEVEVITTQKVAGQMEYKDEIELNLKAFGEHVGSVSFQSFRNEEGEVDEYITWFDDLHPERKAAVLMVGHKEQGLVESILKSRFQP
jgi:hypothetical protein